MRNLFLGLVVCAIGSPAHADVVVDFTFSGPVFAVGAVPGGGNGGQLATATGALTFDETGNAIPASQIFISVSGIPDIQTEIGLGGEDLYLNSFDVGPDGEFLGGKFAYATPEGSGGPSVELFNSDPEEGSYSLSNHSETNYFLEDFDGDVTFTQETPVSEPWTVAVFATGLLGLLFARSRVRHAI